jgi:hypothetical protein
VAADHAVVAEAVLVADQAVVHHRVPSDADHRRVVVVRRSVNVVKSNSNRHRLSVV